MSECFYCCVVNCGCETRLMYERFKIPSKYNWIIQPDPEKFKECMISVKSMLKDRDIHTGKYITKEKVV